MYFDYHVHTEYSDDSFYPMEKVVKDAIAMGIEEICFTDHVDYGIKTDPEYLNERIRAEYERNAVQMPAGDDPCWRDPVWLTDRKETLLNVDYPRYVEEIRRLQEKYQGKIVIKMGLEFGIQTHTIWKYEKLFRRFPFDFILLSIHQVEDKEFWTQEFQAGRSQEEYHARYYQEMYDVVTRFHDYSVLAHMDLITRYDKNGAYPFEKIEPYVRSILEQVIQDGKGIEVNTSSFYYGLKDLTPSRHILKLYRELGGTIVTVGSDSHKEVQLGAHIPEIYQELKQMGFGYVCTYEKMQPVYHEL